MVKVDVLRVFVLERRSFGLSFSGLKTDPVTGCVELGKRFFFGVDCPSLGPANSDLSLSIGDSGPLFDMLRRFRDVVAVFHTSSRVGRDTADDGVEDIVLRFGVDTAGSAFDFASLAWALGVSS
jgi:hypothetical protein